jgi:hypothetical protein
MQGVTIKNNEVYETRGNFIDTLALTTGKNTGTLKSRIVGNNVNSSVAIGGFIRLPDEYVRIRGHNNVIMRGNSFTGGCRYHGVDDTGGSHRIIENNDVMDANRNAVADGSIYDAFSVSADNLRYSNNHARSAGTYFKYGHNINGQTIANSKSNGGNTSVGHVTAAMSLSNIYDKNQRLTYTPTLGGTTVAGANTYSAQFGEYVVDGNMCNGALNITMSAKDGAMDGAIFVTLPVTVRNNGSIEIPVAVRCSSIDIDAGYTMIAGYAQPNTNRLRLNFAGDNNTIANALAASISATSRVSAAFSYMIETP